jgi:hypothetical protein
MGKKPSTILINLVDVQRPPEFLNSDFVPDRIPNNCTTHSTNFFCGQQYVALSYSAAT